MTNGEVYVTVRKHLMTQREKSTLTTKAASTFMITGKVVCAYRGERGLKCAIGCLIPDGKYSWTMETQSVNRDEVYGAAGLTWDQAQTIGMELQAVHDSYPVELWPQYLDSVAWLYNLCERCGADRPDMTVSCSCFDNGAQ